VLLLLCLLGLGVSIHKMALKKVYASKEARLQHFHLVSLMKAAPSRFLGRLGN